MLPEKFRTIDKIIGIRQSIKAVNANKVKSVVIAKDVDERIITRFKGLCNTKNIEIIYFETMKQLGKASGIDVGAAIVCILK